MAKVSESISMEKSTSDKIRALAKEQERTFSWIGEKILLKGLEALENEKAKDKSSK